MVKKPKGLQWLEDKYNVDPSSLDENTRKLAKKLGPEGIQNLVEDAAGKTEHRGQRLSVPEKVGLLRQLNRLAEEGGGSWIRGERSLGQRPVDWLPDEAESLEDQ